MKLVVVGLGLIGGSIALDLKSQGFVNEIIGVDNSPENAAEALTLGIVDKVATLEEALVHSDLVVLAIPVNAITKILPFILDRAETQTTVTDVGSTKTIISLSVANHPKKSQFVPSHPMAGTEFSGPKAAHLGLFKNKAAIICGTESTTTYHLNKVKNMYLALGMRIIFMTPDDHDLHTAYVSHLSHISSFVLANTVLDKEKNESTIFNLASAGFESTVRLAKSSPEMWAPIFEHNNKYIIEALGSYLEHLQNFYDHLKNQDFEKTKDDMRKSNDIKRVLKQIEVRKPKD